MAGGSMFEGCLSADITASLRSGVGSWNETAAGQRLARVLVKVESKRRAGTGASSLDEFWASGDHLNGTVSVEFVQPVTIVRARVSLEGMLVHYCHPRNIWAVIGDTSFRRLPYSR